MGRKLNLVRHMSKQELEAKYKQEKNPRVKERLLAILLLYQGKKVSELPSIIKRSRTSIEDWIKRWNNQGYQGLIPHFTGGPKPKISDWDKVIDEIENKGMTLRDVVVYIKNSRGVTYSYKTVWYILRKKKKVKYGKPYIKNIKRPDDAEDTLKKRSSKF
jgi:putative transposase